MWEKLKKIPVTLFGLLFITALYGFVVLYAAAGGSITPWAYKQIMMFCIFAPLSLIIACSDIRIIYRYAYHIYVLSFAMLLIVEFFGTKAMGATRWINLGLFKLQPSELMKISVVLALARYLHNVSAAYANNLFALMPAIILALLPAFLVIVQPDLGTGMVIIIISSVIFFVFGIKFRYFMIIIGVVITAMPVLWNLLHNYQKNRVLTFLNPERDPLGAGYNIIQSKIAIGSGGIFGKGLFEGSQSHLSFLPEHQTDFVFAFLAEELGFLGGIVLLCLYLSIIMLSIAIAFNARTKFAKLLSVGIVSIFSAHVFINMGMVMGLLPVVGVPLPLISYGGTMMVSMLLGFGFIMNAAVHRNNNV